ncbi:MAG: hypothetical protein IPM92_14215 [Saprospiraceae bacterium]|nr:hypothetical protein [Saprospiraceae bacterium]
MLLFISGCLYLNSVAQTNLAIGAWLTHLPYNSGNQVTESDHFVYYATDYGILKVHKSDFSFERISRTEGLSGTQINAIYFHKASQQLLIAYSNGVIDLLGDNGVQTVVDILNFNNIPVDKTINRITLMDDNNVFISGHYGLSQLNVNNLTFKFTLFTPNIKVYDCAVAGNFYYMATENGLYSFENNGTGIIQALSSWTLLGGMQGLPQNSAFLRVATLDDEIYANTSKSIFQAIPGQTFELFYADPAYDIKYLRAGNEHLLVGLKCKNACADQLAFFDATGNSVFAKAGCADQNLDAIESENGNIWIADTRWSFRFTNSINENCNEIWVNGPLSNRAWEIATLNDAVYVAVGGVDATFTPNYNSQGIAKFEKGNWSMINSGTEPDLQNFSISDIIRVVESPDKSKIYYASSGKGLIEYNRTTDQYKVYNKTNSPLKGTVGDTGNIRLSGLAFDKKGTLWITNYLAPVGLLSLDKDGNWKEYVFPNNSNLFTEVKVDQNGYKWIISRLNGGVMVFDEGDANNPNDDQRIQLTNSNSEMTSNDVRTVEVDLDGDVWVGTAEGPVVFECGSSIFSGSCKGSRRKVDQDGIIYFLLASEVITSVAIDGANRKWFGTSNNGIYVQSSTGEFEIHHFDIDNSPLLDNAIQDIAIDPKTGEAWIASNGGLQVYRSDATLAKDQFTETPLVFPNPVPHDYEGPIAIRGLARDARYKITDFSGRLVYENFANGGQAIWNGRDYLGRKVASGIYLVFANTTQDFETADGLVTKIVVGR